MRDFLLFFLVVILFIGLTAVDNRLERIALVIEGKRLVVETNNAR